MDDPRRLAPPGDGLRARIEAEIAAAGWLARRIGPARIARWAGLEALLALREAALRRPEPRFEEALLAALGIRWEIAAGQVGAIPPVGPLLVVCNHPTGALEALIAASLIDRRRRDRRNLGNRLVAVVPELAARQIGVGPGGAGNRGGLRAALRHLAGGGCLLAFPAGTVAHARPPSLRVAEAPWHPGLARLAERADAAVLALHVAARPSRLWRLTTPLSRAARTALLPRELLAQRGARVAVRIGRAARTPEDRAALFAAH